jgi:uncharacterized protein
MIDKDAAERFTLLRSEVGSTVHGLGVGTDDRDEMGVLAEPPEYVIGLEHFEQFVWRSKPEGVRSQPGDLDLVIYSLRKWCSLALKGNPSVLLLLFTPREACTVWTDEAARLREMAWAFASRKAGASFLGYMQQQRMRLLGERGQMRVHRPELVEAYGFDTKYAGHILRLGFQGVDYMRTGRIVVPMDAAARDYIVAVRNGEHDMNSVLTRAGELEQELKGLCDASPLPDEPDREAVNVFLAETYERVWAQRR